jgi:hypothetical protein
VAVRVAQLETLEAVNTDKLRQLKVGRASMMSGPEQQAMQHQQHKRAVCPSI